MVRVRSCCGLGDIRVGARNIAFISMIYDLLMMAALLLVLLLHVPYLPWMKPAEQNSAVTSSSILVEPEPRIAVRVYQILIIITVTIRSIHLIPSFLLLYSTWGEIPRGVSFWLFMGVLDVLIHLTWVGVPLWMKWPLDKAVILITFLLIGVIIILYFIVCVKSYADWLRDRHHDLRAKRRLKDDY